MNSRSRVGGRSGLSSDGDVMWLGSVPISCVGMVVYSLFGLDRLKTSSLICGYFF